MKENKEVIKKSKNNSNKRVKFFKKAIITMMVALLVLPSVLMVFVCIRLGNVERELKDFKEDVYGTHDEEPNYSESPDGYSYSLNVMDSQNVSDNSVSDSENIVIEDNSNPVDTSEKVIDPYVEKKKVCITFDDGPSARTNDILNILDNYGVKATFFVNAKDGFEDQYKRIVEDGHTLGMHSYSHNYQSVYHSLDSFAEDLYGVQSYLKDITGVEAVYYRFPGGSSNKVSHVDMKECIKYINAKGISYFDWNVSAQDAVAGGASTKEIVSNVINTIENGEEDTYVVLMHDAQDKRTTVEALPIIIEKLADMEDVVIVPIDENISPIRHVSVEEEF